MHPIAFATAVASLFATGAVSAESAPPPAPAPTAAVANPQVEEAKALAKTFAGTLKGELEAAIKSGGPVRAIEVCKERAPAIAADISAKSGWKVGRTSLKVRNAKLDTPDAWERSVLEQFDRSRAAGESADTMAYSAIVESDGAKQFRFMKAIPTGEVCLACHGTQIAPETAAALDRAYPGDQARGYKVGDVRGAFSLSKSM